MPDRRDNPVVLLSGDTWHIVESSRESAVGLCGRPIRERRAHSRLRTVGRDHVCPACLKAFDAVSPHNP
ncbi:MAG: hypothetical protein R3C44_20860 [Chloroflexota bacterium]